MEEESITFEMMQRKKQMEEIQKEIEEELRHLEEIDESK